MWQCLAQSRKHILIQAEWNTTISHKWFCHGYWILADKLSINNSDYSYRKSTYKWSYGVAFPCLALGATAWHFFLLVAGGYPELAHRDHNLTFLKISLTAFLWNCMRVSDSAIIFIAVQWHGTTIELSPEPPSHIRKYWPSGLRQASNNICCIVFF